MKIYFAFTVVGDRSAIENAKKIVELLESMGHEVLTRHLVREDVYRNDRLVPAQEIYHRDMKWLQQCDLLIAEVSATSFGVGYEVGYLLGSSGKRAILFYQGSLDKTISLLVKGNTHPNCKVVAYADISEVEEFLKKNL